MIMKVALYVRVSTDNTGQDETLQLPRLREIALCEDEYEILHEVREIVMNSSKLLEVLHRELPYDLNIIAANLERMIDGHVERIFESGKEYRGGY